MNDEQIHEFYTRFREELNSSGTLPGLYTFKFIAPSDESVIARILQIFESSEPTISYKESKNGKYTSISITMFQIDADGVISYYKEVGKIENVMML